MAKPDAPSEQDLRAEVGLITSSSKWMSDAFRAWAEDDYAKVAVLAPLALEHLGKAVLWRVNPVLLVPLTPDSEQSLLGLATKPDITDPRLRTIGLALLLRRLELVTSGVALLEKGKRDRVVAVRNGAMHVGSPVQSRHVLLDCLAIIRSLLEYLGEDPKSFYGENYWSACALLDEKRTEVGHKVAAKRAKARLRLTELEKRLGQDAFQALTDALEEEAGENLDPADFGMDLHGVDRSCPECGLLGRLFGRVDAESEPDWDVGDFRESYIAGIMWKVTLYPHAFACNVCHLTLNGAEELAECAFPTAAESIELEELGEDFDPDVLGYSWSE